MKYPLLTYFFKTCILGLFLLLFAPPSFGQYPDKINLPPEIGDVFPGGTMAYDIIEANGFIFIYSLNRVQVYTQQNIPCGYIPFGNDEEWGKFNPFYYNPRLYMGSINFMAYHDFAKRLYIVKPNMEIVVVDVNHTGSYTYNEEDIVDTYSPFDDISELDSVIFNPLCGSNIIKIDSENNRLYWVAITGKIDTAHTGSFHFRERFLGLYTFDGLDYNLLLHDYEIVDYTNYRECAISDVSFNQMSDSDYYYLSKLNKIEVRKFNDSLSSPELFEFQINGYEYFDSLPAGKEPHYKFSKIEYINNTTPHLVVFPPYRYPNSNPLDGKEADFFVMSADHTDSITDNHFRKYPVPSQRITDCAFLSGNNTNDLILSYAPDENETTWDSIHYNIHDIVVFSLNNAGTADFTKLATLNTDLSTVSHNYDINVSLRLLPINPNTLLISKKDEIIELSYTGTLPDYYTTDTVKAAENNIFGPGVNTGGYSFILNLASNGLERIVNSSPSDPMHSRTAYPVYHAVCDQNFSKLIFFNKLNNHGAGLYITSIDTNNNETTININNDGETDNDINYGIADCIYNPYTDQFLIGERSDDPTFSRILIIDNDGNSYNTEINLPDGVIHPEKMFIGPNKKLYVSANMINGESPIVLVYTAAATSTLPKYTLLMLANITMLGNLNNAYYSSYFEYNPGDRKVYMSIHPKSVTLDPYLTEDNSIHSDVSPYEMGSGAFYVIDDTLQNIEYNIAHPQKIICPSGVENSQYQDKIFIIGEELFVYDYKQKTFDEYSQTFNDIVYCPITDQIFALSDEGNAPNEQDYRIAKVYKINCFGDSITYSEVLGASIGGQMASMFYNEYNGKIYLYHRTDEKKRGGTQIRLTRFDPQEDPINLNYINLGLVSFYPEYDHGPDFHYYFYNTISPIINPYNNTVYIPNGGLSSISKVNFQARESLSLNNETWTWLSVPRMDRSFNNSVNVNTVFSNINLDAGEFIDSTELRNLPIGEPNEIVNYYTEDDIWDPNSILQGIQSTWGYKLKFVYQDGYTPPSRKWLHMQGSLYDHFAAACTNCSFNLDTAYTNKFWVGYYYPFPQNILDAIPDEFEHKISVIKGQYFTCYGTPQGDGSVSWQCGINKHGTIIDYGDMVEIITIDDIFDFYWAVYNTPPSSQDREETEYYSYREAADYTPIFIELDTTENPLEIGAFVNDSCIGASIVLPEDTIVLVPAYSDSLAGEIYFEQHYGTSKSNSPPITEYYVENIKSRTRAKRMIHTNEKQDYFVVSFRNDKKIKVKHKTEAWLTCNPNPVRSGSRISFFIPDDGIVEINLYSIMGRLQSKLFSGQIAKGKHEIMFNAIDEKGNTLKNGTYIISLQSAKGNAQAKVVILSKQ